MDFRETIERIRAEDADVRRLFGGDGKRVRSAAHSEAYQRNFDEALEFIGDVYEGRRPLHHLREALTTADFPLLFGDVIDRQLLANYQETPQTYRQYARIGTVPDFRTVKRFAINGAESVLGVVAQGDTYPLATLSDVVYSYQVQKWGRIIDFSWESMVDDDLDALKDIPARFGSGARRSEEKFATALYAGQIGTGRFYSDANKNTVDIANGASSDNPVLTEAALQDAYSILSHQVDSDGEPIAIDMVVLVVPPALKVAAENLLNATEIWSVAPGAGASTGRELHVANWMRAKTKLAVATYLPIVDGTHGNTAWYLFADPGSTVRPALEVGFLRGHESPELFMKDPQTIAVGGGASADAMNGDFDTDTIRYKVRHVFGGALMDPKMSVASSGGGAALGTSRGPALYSAAKPAQTEKATLRRSAKAADKVGESEGISTDAGTDDKP